jgi:hypothetical protein
VMVLSILAGYGGAHICKTLRSILCCGPRAMVEGYVIFDISASSRITSACSRRAPSLSP